MQFLLDLRTFLHVVLAFLATQPNHFGHVVPHRAGKERREGGGQRVERKRSRKGKEKGKKRERKGKEKGMQREKEINGGVFKAHLNTSTPQHLNTSTRQHVNSSTPNTTTTYHMTVNE
jgi:hypothetical protein